MKRNEGWLPPQWWDQCRAEGFDDNAILHACAQAGMTAEQALVEMAKAHEELLERFRQHVELSSVPVVVTTEKSG